MRQMTRTDWDRLPEAVKLALTRRAIVWTNREAERVRHKASAQAESQQRMAVLAKRVAEDAEAVRVSAAALWGDDETTTALRRAALHDNQRRA